MWKCRLLLLFNVIASRMGQDDDEQQNVMGDEGHRDYLRRLILLQYGELNSSMEKVDMISGRVSQIMGEGLQLLQRLEEMDEARERRKREVEAEREDGLQNLYELGKQHLFNESSARVAQQRRAGAEEQAKEITLKAVGLHENFRKYSDNANDTMRGLRDKVEQLRSRRDNLKQEVEKLVKHKKKLKRDLGPWDIYRYRTNVLTWSIISCTLCVLTVVGMSASKWLGVCNAVLLGIFVMIPVCWGHEINGYDCTTMKGIRAYGGLNMDDCTPGEEQQGMEMTFHMIQKVKYTDMTGFTCGYKTSSFWYYCGMFQHSSTLSVPHIEISQPVSGEQCRAWSKGQAIVAGQGVSIEPGTETIVWTTPAGALVRKGTSVGCTGQRVRVNGDLTDGAVHLVQHRIVVTRVKLQMKKDKVRDITNRVNIDCQARFQQCPRTPNTYIWDLPAQACPAMITRKGRGKKKMIEGKEVLISIEDKIYMELGEEITLCGGIRARETKYNDIFIVENRQNLESVEITNSTQVSISTYVGSRDDFLSFLIDASSKDMAKLAKHSDCSNEARHGALQNKIRKEGGDRFSVLKGEVEYSFQCQMVVVNTRESENCYEGLKISYKGKNKFLTPDTGLIVDHSPEVTCNRVMPMGWQTRHGNWITQAPNTMTMKEPESYHHRDAWNMERHKHVSMTGDVGVYSRRELEESWSNLQYGNFKEMVTTRLANTICNRTPGYNCPTHQGLTLTDLVDKDPLHNIMKTVWDTMYNDVLIFGTVSAAIIGLYIIAKLLLGIMTYVINLMFLLPAHGLSWRTMRHATTSQIARTAYARALERTILAFKAEDREGGERGDVGMERQDRVAAGDHQLERQD